MDQEPELGAGPKHKGDDHFHVEYVVHYSFKKAEQPEAVHQFKRVVKALNNVGLETAVRPATNDSLFIFVKPIDKYLERAIHRSRVKDWLYGVCQTQPGTEDESTARPVTEGERLRTIFHMITWPLTEGGAGITPKHGAWKCVESVFPLHDKEVNTEWIKQWSQKTFLSSHDLDQIRARLGERVAFYFAFLQNYFAFLFFPAAFGFFCWALLGQFSIIYAVVNSLACLVFVEFWKRREKDLALRWQVPGVSAIKAKRRQFTHEKEVVDKVTGETVLVFPATTRLSRQLLQIPFALVAVFALGALIASCFAIEIFITEVYAGPFKTYLAFIPTILLSCLSPTISGALTKVATRLTDYENYETQDSYDVALTQKIFVLDFITSYLPIFLTAFVYVPFAQVIVPHLDIFQLTAEKSQAGTSPAKFQIDRSRLRGQVIYFSITGQIVNLGLETVLPYVKRKAFNKYREMSEDKAQDTEPKGASSNVLTDDAPAEAKFLKRVRQESELTDYDTASDLREMCEQFGYLTLFSPVWPLVPVAFLVNNWVELRSDFVKICVECKRPAPLRSDSIGPWLDALGFLSWLGSITSAALVYMFSDEGDLPDGTPSQIKGWVLLTVIFFSEHLYLLARSGVQIAFSKIESPETRQARGQRFMLRKGYLDQISKGDKTPEETQSEQPNQESLQQGGKVVDEKITRASLEEDARRFSQHSATASDRFWARQRGWKESAQVGVGIIQAEYSASMEQKKDQ